jgi:transcriptional regulator with XRE-family HTH domain
MSLIQNNLKECRKNAGLTQLEVAQQLGLKSMDRISKWEHGRKNPSIENLFRLAKIYEVKAEELYTMSIHNRSK